jgi:hypothetical protein
MATSFLRSNDHHPLLKCGIKDAILVWTMGIHLSGETTGGESWGKCEQRQICGEEGRVTFPNSTLPFWQSSPLHNEHTKWPTVQNLLECLPKVSTNHSCSPLWLRRLGGSSYLEPDLSHDFHHVLGEQTSLIIQLTSRYSRSLSLSIHPSSKKRDIDPWNLKAP